MQSAAEFTVDLKAANQAMDKAKIELMGKHDSAFFLTICFSLRHIWDESLPTAATNGLEIRYNPAFFMKLTNDERVFLMLHETLHCAFIHMERLNEREHKRWNAAADYVINAILIDRGYSMPAGGLYDSKYSDMSTEQVYDLLEDQQIPECDMDLMSPDAESSVLKEEMGNILVRAKLQAQMSGQDMGQIPGELRRYLDELTNPKLPWNRILAKFVSRLTKSDYSFRKPNRRFMPDHILPTMYSESLGNIAVAIDTSGSVSDERFAGCIAELYPILKNLRPERMTLMQFDTEIKAINELTHVGQLRQQEFTGYGGTNIQPVMDWAATNKPDVLVIFTDGYFRESHTKPACPIIWIIYENPGFKAKHGKVIQLD